jgi:6-phosphogluconolactonase (cycloisomerase 2 family)
MRSLPGRFALVALSLVCVLVLTACCSSSTPVLRYLAITPSSATVDAGTTQQFTATAYYSDGTQQDQTSVVGWSSSVPGVATITPTGVASALANGTTTITASAVGAQATATLTVSRTIQSLTITPATALVALGSTQQYDAMATFLLQNGTTITQDVTNTVTWNSSNNNITISTGGLATAPTTGTGFADITATLDGLTSNVGVLSLGGTAVTGLQVTPATSTIAVTNTTNLTALELLSNNTTQPLSNPVTYAVTTCTPTGAASVASNGTNGLGIVTGVLPGTCTITATEGTFTGTSTITVVTGNAHYAYVANGGSSTISQFSVAATSGTPLTPLAPATVAATVPQQVFLHPSGLFAYTIDSSSNVYVYDVVPGTGLMTLSTVAPISAGAGGTNIGVVDPTGRFLYVIDETADTVDGFAISPVDGSLTAMATNVTGLTSPSDVLIDQTGQYLYVINSTSPGTINGYTISQTDGTLTPLSTPSFTVGNGPIFATISSAAPATPFMYVPNSVDNTVTVLALDPTTGLLSPVGTPTAVPGAGAVINAIVDPTGSFLYVLDGGATGLVPGQIYGFNVAAGVIGTAIAGTPLPTDPSPGGMAIDPTGKLIAVDFQGANVPGGIDLFKVGSAGALTADAPVTVGNTPFGVVFYVAP